MRGPGESEPAVKLSLVDIGGWPGMLRRLGAGQDLTSAQATVAMREILEGTATASQIAAFIFGLRCKGETSEELTGMLQAMLEVAETVPLPYELANRLADTCGTGGDRAGTINVSTIAALVVAGAGVPVSSTVAALPPPERDQPTCSRPLVSRSHCLLHPSPAV